MPLGAGSFHNAFFTCARVQRPGRVAGVGQTLGWRGFVLQARLKIRRTSEKCLSCRDSNRDYCFVHEFLEDHPCFHSVAGSGGRILVIAALKMSHNCLCGTLRLLFHTKRHNDDTNYVCVNTIHEPILRCSFWEHVHRRRRATSCLPK